MALWENDNERRGNPNATLAAASEPRPGSTGRDKRMEKRAALGPVDWIEEETTRG